MSHAAITPSAATASLPPRILAIDAFCGAGGLSYGMKQAGVTVVAGIDLDPACSYPFEANVEAPFLQRDIRDITGAHLSALWRGDSVRVFAGCAPCQPFSSYRRGVDTSAEEEWSLIDDFSNLVKDTKPELVTMENVPRALNTKVFQRFIKRLRRLGYSVDWRSCRCVDYGLAQTRRRLVLIASLLGEISIPAGSRLSQPPITVRDVIGSLPKIKAGQIDAHDSLHRSRSMSKTNLKRIEASKPRGTWLDWPEELRAPCHRKESGATYRNVYARMAWDEPSPTITTLAHNFGTGRFGHPVQNRAISLREAAMLQSFPPSYRFVKAGAPVHFTSLGRLIGNAVPPLIGQMIGSTIVDHVTACLSDARHA